MKFTRKVRRGLCLVRRLMLDVCDDSKPPAASIVAKWPRRWQDDYNAAVDWMASVEVEPEEPRRPISTRGAGAQLARSQRPQPRPGRCADCGADDPLRFDPCPVVRDVPDQLLLEGVQ